jgi:hypothetical protein
LSARSRIEFMVRSHAILLERLERLRWRVTIDGRLLATFCSESRARAAGRTEARRLDFVAADARLREAGALPAPK